MAIVSYKEERTKRNTNIELLRIFAMFIIILHHFVVHSDILNSVYLCGIPKIYIYLIQLGGPIGIDIFVLISGYFLINQEKSKISKILLLWLQILFYSLSIYLLSCILNNEKILSPILINIVMSITYNNWWFASAYFCLYIFSPYINKLLKSLDKKTYEFIIIVVFIMWCIIPTVTGSFFQSNRLLWFIFLYSVSSYIRIYEELIKDFKKSIFAIITFLTIAFTILAKLIFEKNALLNNHIEHFLCDAQSLNIFIIAVSVFCFFIKLDIKQSKVINTIASTSFGVYLIHENNYVRDFIWKKAFNILNYADSILIIPYSIFVALIIYCLCSLVELLRQRLLERLYIEKIKKFER